MFSCSSIFVIHFSLNYEQVYLKVLTFFRYLSHVSSTLWKKGDVVRTMPDHVQLRTLRFIASVPQGSHLATCA